MTPCYRPPVPSPKAPAICHAEWAASFGKPTVDQWWLLREAQQDERNVRRRADWETRFKVLGPRPASEKRDGDV